MSITPHCDKCKQELIDFGGILLSPPEGVMVKKFHLCKKCYAELAQGIDEVI